MRTDFVNDFIHWSLDYFLWREAKELYVRYEPLHNHVDVMFVHYFIYLKYRKLTGLT